jgi:outer membrane protein OmpA-like peptidoglycan-associated protein
MKNRVFSTALIFSLATAGAVSAQDPYSQLGGDEDMSAEAMTRGIQSQVEQLTRGGWTFVRPADAENAAQLDTMVDDMVAVGSVGDAYGVIEDAANQPSGATTTTTVTTTTVVPQPVSPNVNVVPQVAATEGVAQPTVPTAGVYVLFREEDRVDVSIKFDLNSANIRAEAVPQLQQICQFLAGNQELGLNLVGHTDTSGPADYNLQLSTERANSVRTYLVSQCAVQPQRLYSFGLGETIPLEAFAPTDPRNRRVELQVALLQ